MCQLEEKNTSPNLDVLIQVDKLQLLYQQSYPAIYVSTFAAIILITMLWPVQDHTVLVTWLTVLMITALCKIYLFERYRHVAPKGQDILAWEKPYFITLILLALVWGGGSLLIMPVASKVHQATIYCVLIGFCGDAVLEHISKILQQRFRKTDISARIGGEEFGILLPTANPETSEKLAEELRQEIEESSIVFNENNIKVTASLGVKSGDSVIDTLVKHADIAMYRAKESGRNNVVCYKSGAMRSAQSK
jgi:hypothetical protein